MLRPSSIPPALVPLLMALFTIPTTFAGSHNTNRVADPNQPSSSAAQSAPLLPNVFAGWKLTGSAQQSSDPHAADNGDAAVLKEYGFTHYEMATYSRDERSLTLKAMEFGDATGAFGAFTFYRRPNMSPERIGQGAAYDGVRILFWNGAVLVDAKFNQLTPMSASELRDLVTQLPQPSGNLGTPPRLPTYLPSDHLEPLTIAYAIGPVAYESNGGVLPPDLVDFQRSAEVVTAQYNALNGDGTLTIINYPTPDIAIDREHAIQSYITSHGRTGDGASKGWTSALAESNSGSIQSRRSGPLVAVTSGNFPSDVARELLQDVHYETNLTAGNPSHYVPEAGKVAQIILGVAFMVGIFAIIAIIAGVSLGGGRVMLRKMRSKSGVAEDESAEFIRLNLKD